MMKTKIGKAIALVAFFIISMTFVPLVRAGNDDANSKEVMVEWVEDYTARGWGYLDHQQEEATAFYNRLGNLGWTKRGNWGNDTAWESDFEKSSVGGWDTSYIDSVDFAYFTGHGSPSHFSFGYEHDGDGAYTWMVHHSEVEWGDTDLEWIALACCNCLQESGIRNRWGTNSVFKGLHGILGFHSTSQATGASLPNKFVDYMIEPRTIGNAWILATYYDQSSYDPEGNPRYAAYLSADDPTSVPHVVPSLSVEYLPGYGYVGPDVSPPHYIFYSKWQC